MKLNKKLLQKYNTNNSLIVISSYPKKREKYSRGVCAVASFTKNTLQSIQEHNKNKKIIVLSMILKGQKEVYEEDEMLIVRCFSRNNLISYRSVFAVARKFSNVKNVLVEFEFASFGDTLTTAGLALLVWSLRLFGKKITLVIHQVVLDLAILSGHVGMNKFLISIFNLLLKAYYTFLSLPVSSIVVLEESLKNRLSKFTRAKKIHIIPHGVDTNLMTQSISKDKARIQINVNNNELVILCFGYVTWYKGTDFLVEALKNTTEINGKKIRLIIAGGKSFTQQKKKHYQNYYQNIVKQVTNTKHIMLTGFINETDIPKYFAAADVVVFPYRAFMSSSGPLATALSFGKPVMFSSNLNEMFLSHDVKDSLLNAKLTQQDLVFDINKKSFLKTLRRITSENQMKKLAIFSTLLQQKRSFTSLAPSYCAIIDTKPKVNTGVTFGFLSFSFAKRLKNISPSW